MPFLFILNLLSTPDMIILLFRSVNIYMSSVVIGKCLYRLSLNYDIGSANVHISSVNMHTISVDVDILDMHLRN